MTGRVADLAHRDVESGPQTIVLARCFYVCGRAAALSRVRRVRIPTQPCCHMRRSFGFGENGSLDIGWPTCRVAFEVDQLLALIPHMIPA